MREFHYAGKNFNNTYSKMAKERQTRHFLACYINILSSSTFSLNTSTEENSEFYKKEKK